MTRFALHQTISDYANIIMPDISSRYRLANYYVNLLNQYGDNSLRLIEDYDNIFSAVEYSYNDGQYENFIRLSLGLYPLLEARGLYEQARSLMLRVESVARSETQEAFLAECLRNLGRLQHRQGSYAA